MRICITGGPGTGKTTLSKQYSVPVFHSDDFVKYGWDAQKTKTAALFNSPGPWVIEGVAVARALRHWLRISSKPPCDLLIVRKTVYRPISNQERNLLSGTETVIAGLIQPLRRLGVAIKYD